MPSISALYIYPVKSCAGIAVDHARLLDTGLEYDRNWLVTDPHGAMLTQRVWPRMALIQTAIGEHDLILKAPGMPELRTPLDASAFVDAPTLDATVWRDTMRAFDTGDVTAQWFSTFLGTEARLLRFDPQVERVVDPDYTGAEIATTFFADGFPLLVIGESSLDDLNARLAQKGVPALAMNRFRPNVVVSGLDAYEEDYVERVEIETQEGAVALRFVKLCARCPIPTIDQTTGAPHPDFPHEPTDTMSGYRANEARGGAVTFGQNALVADGAGARLAVGQPLEAELAFGD